MVSGDNLCPWKGRTRTNAIETLFKDKTDENILKVKVDQNDLLKNGY
jgi:hypothetical protein